MATSNNHLNTYTTKEEAETQLGNMLKNNNPETLAELCGKKLMVQPVECYDTGDSTRTVFGFDVEVSLDILEWTPYATYEALEEGVITSDELIDDCDLVYGHAPNPEQPVYWIQRIFNRSSRVYEFYTRYERSEIIGSFGECASFLIQNINL